jgi:hypothetical protein
VVSSMKDCEWKSRSCSVGQEDELTTQELVLLTQSRMGLTL